MGKFFGINNYSEIPGIFDWDPRFGQRWVRHFRGPPDPVNALALGFQNSRTPFSRVFDPHGGYSTISPMVGAADSQSPTVPLADLWDLVGNDIEKSIWLSPGVQAELQKIWDLDGGSYGGLDAYLVDLGWLRSDVETLAKGETVQVTDPNNPTAPPQTLTITRFMAIIDGINTALGLTGGAAVSKDVFRQLLWSLAVGNDTFVISQWVLRRKLTVAQNFAPTSADWQPKIYGNVNKVYQSTADLISIEGIPVDVGTQVINAANSPTLWLPEGVWLKKSPTREQIAGDKWQFTIEWWNADTFNPLAYVAVAHP